MLEFGLIEHLRCPGKRLGLGVELRGDGANVAQDVGGDVAQSLDLVGQDGSRHPGFAGGRLQSVAQVRGLIGQAGVDVGKPCACIDKE